MCHNQQQQNSYPPPTQYSDYYYTPETQYYPPPVDINSNQLPVPPPKMNKPTMRQEEEEDRTPPLPPGQEDDSMELDSPNAEQPPDVPKQPSGTSNLSPPTIDHNAPPNSTPIVPQYQQYPQYPQQQWGGPYQDHHNQYNGYGSGNTVQQPYNPVQSYYGHPQTAPYQPEQYYRGYYPYNQPQGYYQQSYQHHNQGRGHNHHDRWNQSQQQQQQQRIVRSEPVNTPPPPSEQESQWGQPQYPQWEGQPSINQHPVTTSPRGRGRGTRGKWVQSPGRQSRWDMPSNQTPEEVDNKSVSSTNDEDIQKSEKEKNVLSAEEIDISMDPSQWPPKLRNYLMRSFESCKCDGDRDHVEQYLKVEITAMFQDKRVWQIDWDNEPLPLDKLKRQGQKRKSRWDTPSPSTDLRSSLQKRLSPQPSSNHPGMQGRLGVQQHGEGTGRGRGRGRGRGKKKQWGMGKKGKFYIDRTGNGNGTSYVVSDEDKVRVNIRSQRFARGSEGNHVFKPKMSIEQLMKTVCVSGDTDDWKDFSIEGTSQEIEKRYLRLTSAPDSSTVRPLNVLVKSMEFVLIQWNKKNDYRYACEQFKSIRQDLIIQAIRNDFSVEVYETHARIALQNGDWSEFNQCQSQLRSLYSEGIKGHRAEFMSYRILYHMMTNESADLVQILTEITGDLESDIAVKHAIKLMKAWSFGNYYRFFQLYPSTPHYGRHLVDLFMERQKRNALKTLSKAYRPTLPVEYVTKVLGFHSNSQCVNFLVGCEAILNEEKTLIDCRLTHEMFTK